MVVIRSARTWSGLIVVAAFSLVSAPSEAYTPEEQQACSGDAMRLCGPEIPDVDRITACMIRNKSQLSPPCRAFFKSGPEPGDAGAPVNIRPAGERKAAGGKARKSKKPAKPAAT
jgi:hypothetical protein